MRILVLLMATAAVLGGQTDSWRERLMAENRRLKTRVAEVAAENAALRAQIAALRKSAEARLESSGENREARDTSVRGVRSSERMQAVGQSSRSDDWRAGDPQRSGGLPHFAIPR